MKHLSKIVGLGLASMLVMGMALTATASAAPHWLQCVAGTEGVAPTKYVTSQCTEAAKELKGKWQWNEVTGTEKVRTKGSLLLVDKNTLAGVVKIECSGETEGFVGSGAFGQVTKVNVEPNQCRTIEHCEKVEAIEARNLPWQTELTEPKPGEFVSVLKGTTNGEPGYKVTCKEIIKVTDECINTGPESQLLKNELTGGELLVLATFQKLRKGKCSASTLESKESGEVSGSVATLQLAGAGGLRVSS